MRLVIASLLRRVADWLAPAPVLPEWLLVVTRAAVAHADTLPHTGHFKRAVVLKALGRQHPELRRRDLALAVELVLRERP